MPQILIIISLVIVGLSAGTFIVVLRFNSNLRSWISRQSGNASQIGISDDVKEDDEAKYLRIIQDSSSENKLFVSQHCFNRLPWSIQLFRNLWTEISKEIKNSPLETQVELLRAAEAARKAYVSVCDIEDIDMVSNISDEIEALSGIVLKHLEEERLQELKKSLDKLEDLSKRLDTNKQETVLNDIQQIDLGIDREYLNSYPDLKNRYKIITENLTRVLTKRNPSSRLDEETKIYNIKAIEAHKKALELFRENSSKYKRCENLKELTSLLAGWDNTRLLPSSNVYCSTIYGLIYGKMGLDAQEKISIEMINSKKQQ